MQAIGKKTPTYRILLILFLSAIGCVTSLIVLADELCRRDIARRQPYYPNVELVEREYDFLRPRAMGITHITFHTDDDEETVRQWMRDITLDLLDRDQFHGLASVGWETQPGESGGTLIFYYSECST